MNLERGFGGDFLKGGLTVDWLHHDQPTEQIEGIPGILIRGKNRVFAIGPDATLAIARHNTVYGFARVCYQWEPTRERRHRAAPGTSR